MQKYVFFSIGRDKNRARLLIRLKSKNNKQSRPNQRGIKFYKKYLTPDSKIS